MKSNKPNRASIPKGAIVIILWLLSGLIYLLYSWLSQPSWRVTVDTAGPILVKKTWLGFKKEDFPMKQRAGKWYYRTNKGEWAEFVTSNDAYVESPPYEGPR